MSTSSFTKEVRVWSILQNFKESVFLTLTTADCVGLNEIRNRWRSFRHDYFRAISMQDGLNPRWVMCYEPHPNGHGWHIHIIIEASFLDIHKIRKYSTLAGFGRVHIESVFSTSLDKYISKYVCKIESGLRARGCKRVRLLNVSRGLTRLHDIVTQGAIASYIAACLSCPIAPNHRLWGLTNYQMAIAYLLFADSDTWDQFSCVPLSWSKFRSDCLSSCGSSISSGLF